MSPTREHQMVNEMEASIFSGVIFGIPRQITSSHDNKHRTSDKGHTAGLPRVRNPKGLGITNTFSTVPLVHPTSAPKTHVQRRKVTPHFEFKVSGQNLKV